MACNEIFFDLHIEQAAACDPIHIEQVVLFNLFIEQASVSILFIEQAQVFSLEI